MHPANRLAFFKVEGEYIDGINFNLHPGKRLAMIVCIRGSQAGEALFIDRIIYLPDQIVVIQDPCSALHHHSTGVEKGLPRVPNHCYLSVSFDVLDFHRCFIRIKIDLILHSHKVRRKVVKVSPERNGSRPHEKLIVDVPTDLVHLDRFQRSFSPIHEVATCMIGK
jgi:hypothetical protein